MGLCNYTDKNKSIPKIGNKMKEMNLSACQVGGIALQKIIQVTLKPNDLIVLNQLVRAKELQRNLRLFTVVLGLVKI